ncbi:DUF1850 domain-containing protein [Roseovarius aestuarii]|nr:DUF1850 domain-containing protein [Roseovarius aestuarii]
MNISVLALLCIGAFEANASDHQSLEIELPDATFTLQWMHSIEKSGWEETWRVTNAGFMPINARIKTGGSGMEPPPSSVFVDGWYVYRPEIGPVPEIVIPDSSFTAPMQICVQDDCSPLSEVAKRRTDDIRPIRLWSGAGCSKM